MKKMHRSLGGIVTWIGLLGLIGSAPAQTTFSSETAPRSDEMIAVEGSLPEGHLVALTRLTQIWGDFGDFTLLATDSNGMEYLRRAGLGFEVLDRSAIKADLWVLSLSEAESGEELSSYGVVLWRGPQVALIAASEAGAQHIRQEHPGGGCHRVQRVTRTPWAARNAPPSFGGSSSTAAAADPRIQAMVDQVDQTRLRNEVITLSSYSTRLSTSNTAKNTVQPYLVGRFQGIPNLSVSTFNFDSGADNIVAELTGQTRPNDIYVLGAHWDSINHSGSNAPGADDNASGSSAVLEVARILSQHSFEGTIRFMLFASEELGLVGSNAYAQWAQSNGVNIVGMVNTDMNAYRASGDTRDVDFVTNNTSSSLTNFAIQATQTYVPALGIQQGSLSGGSSDHAAFNAAGFAAIFPFEDLGSYSPFIHTGSDVLNTSANDFTLSRLITQSLVATVAELAVPVDLTITHSPLTDTVNEVGPYLVVADVQSLIGSNVTQVDLRYRVGGGSFATVSMTATGNPNEYAGNIPGQAAPAFVDYDITAMDDQGNSQTSPSNSGTYHSFIVGEVDVIGGWDFEAAGNEGWTTQQVSTQDDWDRGNPASSNSGFDPSSAASGTRVWGNDLSIRGSNWNGEYAANAENLLISPSVDCSGSSNVRLQFNRFLSVEDGFYDQARVEVSGNNGSSYSTIWQNQTTPGGGANHTIDTAWTLQDYDISAIADGKTNVRVRFRLKADAGVQFGGWNVDDVRFVTIGSGKPSFSLSPGSGPAVGSTTVMASGDHLANVVDVQVGGVSVPFQIQSDSQLTFDTPPAQALGATTVTIENAAGPTSQSYTYVVTDPPQIVLPDTAKIGVTYATALGGQPGDLALPLASLIPGNTPLPGGLPTLGIGGGNLANLILFPAFPLSGSTGVFATSFTLSNGNLVGQTLYFQALLSDGLGGFDLTNVDAMTVTN